MIFVIFQCHNNLPTEIGSAYNILLKKFEYGMLNSDTKCCYRWQKPNQKQNQNQRQKNPRNKNYDLRKVFFFSKLPK